ncbi:hypothetical protein DF185_22025 [Marinifilum breve]|uniref:Uncharacterized protein n=1 Tax=Marinifilum breve TaxID=2184082 RepID=A0A2V3ZRT9_9BACT|nr:RagB/SusD family nutrient uptake outer membrane protein [Marinifilum breve]PXX95399.1 hypothetical protein DF185_22025 [Marinifilum breve]
MKSLKYIILFLFISSLSQSCSDDFLKEVDPNNISNQTFWQTEAHARAGINSLYGALSMNYNYGVFEYIYMPENWRSDEFIHKDAAYPSWGTLSTFTNNSNVGEVSSYYSNCYSIISKANQCIAHIPECDMAQDSEEANKKLIDEYVAEAKFFRAYAYFRLLKNFRNPPFVVEEVTSLDMLHPTQVERNKIWELVIDDLKFAVSNLPSKTTRTDGRATSGSAAGYLASVYMFNQNYTDALPVLKNIIDGTYGTYNLTATYRENFNGTNENNIESLFEIQYAVSPKKWRTTHTLEATFAWWGVGVATPWMVDVLNNSKDKDDNIDQRAQDALYGQFAGYENWLEKWNMDDSVEDGTGTYAVNNLVQLRFAEILLYYAEALGENSSDKISEAYTYINRVRLRNNLNDLPAGDQNQFRKDIMTERSIELCFESKRWYDLIRWDSAGWIDLKQTLIDNKKPGASNFDPAKHTFYPIPDHEYETNPNLDRNLQW